MNKAKRLKIIRGLKIEINSLLKKDPKNKKLIKERKKLNKEIQNILYSSRGV